MSIAAILAILVLLVGVPLNLYITAKLIGLSREARDAKLLRERALVAVIVLGITIVFGLIFLNNDMAEPILSGEATKLITRAALLTLAVVPALYWLYLYRGQ